jgi:pilus assembly protein CpaC
MSLFSMQPLAGWTERFRSVARRLVRSSTAAALTVATLAAQDPFVIRPTMQPAPVLPAQMSQPSAVSGRIDAVHSPNVNRLLKPQYKLELERRHSQLLITNRAIRRIAVTDSAVANYVQYTPTELSLVGMELGTTDLTLWFDGDAEPAIYEVTVIRDQSLEEQRTVDFGRLERRLATLFPNSNVYLVPIGNQVIVSGQAYDAEEATHILQIVRSEVLRSLGRYNDLDDGLNVAAVSGGGGGNFNNNNSGNQSGFRDIVVNRLSIPGEFNVMLRVVVAEVNRSELRNAGIDWNVLFDNARHNVFGSVGGGAPNLGGIFENGEITILVRWLASNGTITLLSEPVVTTLSGHPASFLGGGEFAVPTIIGLGGGQTTSFRGFGTSLLVTPTVIDRDLIRLNVIPEFSSLNQDNAVNGIPGTNVKRVQTTVELREGQTFAIGGLISRQTLSEVTRIPLLGDIPWIGSRLFHSKTASEVETELLFLVTPEIVRPMEPDEVPPTPEYYVTHPNDHDLFKYGRTEGSPDTNVYQIAPFGSGATYGIPQGYSLFNPPVNHGGYPTNVMQPQSPAQGTPQSAGQLPSTQLPPPNQPLYPAPQTAPGIAPQQPQPNSPLPPIPQGIQSQHQTSTDVRSKPTMFSRMTSRLRTGGRGKFRTASQSVRR